MYKHLPTIWGRQSLFHGIKGQTFIVPVTVWAPLCLSHYFGQVKWAFVFHLVEVAEPGGGGVGVTGWKGSCQLLHTKHRCAVCSQHADGGMLKGSVLVHKASDLWFNSLHGLRVNEQEAKEPKSSRSGVALERKTPKLSTHLHVCFV